VCVPSRVLLHFPSTQSHEYQRRLLLFSLHLPFLMKNSWEVAFQLKRLEKLAAPLYQRERWLLDDKQKVEERAEVVKEQLEDTVQDAAALQEEMETMLTVKRQIVYSYDRIRVD